MSLLFIGSAFVVLFSLYHSRIRQQRKMVALAESLDSSDRLDRDVFSEVMFEDLNRRLSRDRRLALVDVDSTLRRRFPAMSPDSLPVDTAFLSPSTHNDGSEAMASSSLSDYLRRTYFRGYWNNYEIEVAPCFKNDSSVSVLTMRSFYERLLQSAEPIADTRFRYCPSHLSSFDYLARLETPDAFVYLAFRSVSSSSSFSYPTGLLRSDDEPDISQTLSLARYVNGICVTRRGRYDFPTDDRWIPLDRHSSSFSFSFNDATHFVWFSQRRPLQNSRPDIIVVTRPGTDSFTALLFFWACIFLFFAILVLLARFFYLAVRWWGNGRSSLSLGFVSKMQLAFFMLLMGAFLLVGVLSSFYMVRSYQHRRNATLLNRTRYIRKYLDESFRHSASLRILSREDLNFLCQDIASTYETDLHLYSPSGHLMASSQPFCSHDDCFPSPEPHGSYSFCVQIHFSTTRRTLYSDRTCRTTALRSFLCSAFRFFWSSDRMALRAVMVFLRRYAARTVLALVNHDFYLSCYSSRCCIPLPSRCSAICSTSQASFRAPSALPPARKQLTPLLFWQ